MTANGQTDQTPVFSIEKLYVKDASLEIPHAPQVFLERETPQIEIQLANGSEMIDPGVYQTTVTVTVTAKIPSKTLFLAEVRQAGIFRILHVPAEDMTPLLEITCPNILFPYAREVISDLVMRAGFPPVVLSPVSFEGLYQQRLQEAQAAPATPVTTQ